MQQKFGLQWHITDKCDQRCKHCYIYAGADTTTQNELPIDVLKEILKNFLLSCQKMGRIPSITVTGGDPLLHQDAWDFFELLYKNNVKFSILGNPFHLNDEVALQLRNLGCTNYQMSLDGLRITHDSIRKQGSFDVTLSKIQCLNDVGIKSTIMTTISKLNINEIPQLIPTIVSAQVKNFSFARYCPNENDSNDLVSPEEYKNFLSEVWSIYEKYQNCGTTFGLKDHLWKLFLYEKGYFKIEDKTNIILDGCHCGISHMTVLADGTVYACRRFESPIGHVLEESLYDIFHNSKADAFRNYDEFKACSKCELLRFCRGCPAVTACKTGDFYEKDPQCWKK